MATLSTGLYLAQAGIAGASLNAPASFPRARDAFGKMRLVLIAYAMVGTEATNDLLRLTILKQGDKVICAHSKITGEALGAAVTVSFGDTSNATRYSGTLTVTAIHDLFFSSSPGTDCYVPTQVETSVPPVVSTDQTVVIMKFVGVTTPTAAKKFLVTLAVVAE